MTLQRRDDDERAHAFWQPRLEEQRAKPRNDGCATRAEGLLTPRLGRSRMGGLGGESALRLVGVSGPCNAARLRAVQAGERPLERPAARSKDRPCHYCTKNCSRSGAEAALSEEAACSRSCPTASKRVCRPRSPGLPRLRHSPQRTRAPAPVKQDAPRRGRRRGIGGGDKSGDMNMTDVAIGARKVERADAQEVRRRRSRATTSRTSI